MKPLRLSLIQTDLYWERPDLNMAKFEKKILDIEGNADVILLPEMFTTGFSQNTHKLAVSHESDELKWLSRMAKQADSLIVGSIIVLEKGEYYNQLIWMEPTGSYRTYSKRHLFRMEKEHEHFSSGKERLIGQWRGWKICPMICYDLRFPVWSRNQWHEDKQELDYDLLIYIANWPQRRTMAWETLLQARAIENLSYVIGVNRIGKDGNAIEYSGHSNVIDPVGEVLFNAEEKDLTKTITLNYELLLLQRNKFPTYLDAENFRIL